MKLTPIYTPESVRAVHNLRYDWSGWSKEGDAIPPDTTEVAKTISPLWKTDGQDFESGRVRDDMIQLLFTATPQVSPVRFAQRVKGRLDHAFRKKGSPVSFQRKVAVRTLGDNTRDIVEAYVDRQVPRSDYADSRFKGELEDYSVECAEVEGAWYLALGGHAGPCPYGVAGES